MALRYYVRKARYEDSKDLIVFKDFFLKEAERYEDTYYIDHINWLENKAFPEIKKGISRFAFGAFYRTHYDQRPVLLGGIIVKKSDHSEHSRIELKTITVANNSIWEKVLSSGRGNNGNLKEEIEEEQKNIRTLLLKVVERYASKRAIKKLEVEVPEGNHMLLDVLLKNQFRFIDRYKSKYMKDSVIYSFEKELSLRYCQDPFDFVKMAEWFMERYLKFAWKDSEKESTSNWEKRTFIWDPVTPKDVDNQDPRENIHTLTCGCYIFPFKMSRQEVEAIEETLKEASHHVIYFFSLHENLLLQKISEKYGVKCYFYSNMIRFLFPIEDSEEEIPSIGFPFDKKNIGGLLIVEDGNFSNRIRKVASAFKYLLLNGIGNFLNPHKCAPGEHLYVVFYSPHSEIHGIKGEVWGISKIIDFVEKDFEGCMEEFQYPKTSSPILLFEEKEFEERFQGRWGDSANKDILLLTLEPVNILQNPLILEKFASENVLKIAESDWINGGLMKMYLDRQTVGALLEHEFEEEVDKRQEIVEDINIIIQHIEEGKVKGDTVQKYANRIKTLIERQEIRVAFFLAKKIFKSLNNELYNNVIVLESQWNTTQENLDLSLIDHQEGIRQNSKTMHGFLHLIDKIKQ